MTAVRLITSALLINTVGSYSIPFADPIVKMYKESEMAHLTCSEQFDEQMEILSINYTNGICIHNETFGVKNICNGKTHCRFNVSNSYIGSSCGTKGSATLQVEYDCIRNGGWSDWNTSASCPVTCGGAFWNVTRTCSNPYPNEGGSACTGNAFDEQTCNTNHCIEQDSACLNAKVNWNCPNGHIEVNKAVWETSRTCGFGYISFKTHNVMKHLQSTCNNRTNCSFIAKDHDFGVSCSEENSRCTILNMFTLVKKQLGTTGLHVYFNQSSSDLKADISSGSGYLLLNGIYTINCCGRIKMWEFVPVNTGRLTFVIMRKMSDQKYKFVGYNTKHILETDLRKLTQFNVTEDKRIAITHGDIFGWFDSGSNIVGFHDCLSNNETCPLSYRLNNDVREGDVIDIERLSRMSDRSYTVNYSTTENRPIAVDLPSKPITIPDHFTVNSFVMTIPINDPDNGDYIQDVKLDYDNVYFYFDTKLRSVHVKKTLPHIVGQRNATFNIVVTFEDSCFNFGSANITIASFNAPPEVGGFTEELIIDPTKLSNDSRFHIFNVEDPSNDDIFCGLKNTPHSTEMFVLEMEDNDAYLRLPNQSALANNSLSEYKLNIFCNDGTDETLLQMTVHIRSAENDQSNNRIDTEETDIHVVIIGVCASVSVVLVILFIIAFIRNSRNKLTAKEKSKRGLNTDMSTIDNTVEPNPYVEMEQVVVQQNSNTAVETSIDNKH
ncbi:unnamed protein product [Mytilus edulis]|uniref:Uncharacterized protein n=1 Tax=Mytilus edulis TaxID=6550 RepID=A0A8S3U9Z0_MYTED|nr:unnamed protein product [Mytilus edulis]